MKELELNPERNLAKLIGLDMQNSLIDLLDRLDRRSEDGSAYEITRDYFQGLGFRYVNVGLASASDAGYLGVFSNMRNTWLTHYVDAGYAGCDVIFDYAMRSENSRLCNPETNFLLPSRHKALSNRMLMEIQEEKFISSLILPRHSKVTDHVIGYNLGTDLAEAPMQDLVSAKEDAILLGAALTQAAIIEDFEGKAYGQNWLPIYADNSAISPRETEVLKWLSAGFRNDRIAERLNISPATVNFHITSAKRRLGAHTREQAVAIALTKGLI